MLLISTTMSITHLPILSQVILLIDYPTIKTKINNLKLRYSYLICFDDDKIIDTPFIYNINQLILSNCYSRTYQPHCLSHAIILLVNLNILVVACNNPNTMFT